MKSLCNLTQLTVGPGLFAVVLAGEGGVFGAGLGRDHAVRLDEEARAQGGASHAQVGLHCLGVRDGDTSAEGAYQSAAGIGARWHHRALLLSRDEQADVQGFREAL